MSEFWEKEKLEPANPYAALLSVELVPFVPAATSAIAAVVPLASVFALRYPLLDSFPFAERFSSRLSSR
jgi:hypothetical protein